MAGLEHIALCPQNAEGIDLHTMLKVYDARQLASFHAKLQSLVFLHSRRMRGGIMIPKCIRVMLNKFLSFSTQYDQDNEENESLLPVDVKEGQFAVHTVDDGFLRRSVVELIYLTHPGFLKLLEQAEEEFGFGQMGILVIPCTYSHLQSVTGSR